MLSLVPGMLQAVLQCPLPEIPALHLIPSIVVQKQMSVLLTMLSPAA